MNFKKCLSILLSITLLVGNTMVSYAVTNNGNVDANAGGQQGNASKPTGSGNGSFKIPTSTGYRFTITDKNGNAVSYTPSPDGGYKKGSLDVYNSGVDTNNATGLILGGCATDATSQYIYFISYNDFNELIKSTNEKMPQWIDSNETLYGIEFREWILKKEFIEQNNPPVDTGNSRPSGGSTGGSSSKPSNGGDKKPQKNEGVQANSQTYKNLKRCIEEAPVIRGKSQSWDNSNLKGWYDLRKRTINSAKAEKKITSSEATSLLNKLYKNYQSWLKVIQQEYKIQTHDKKMSFNDISNLFIMTSYAATTEAPKVGGEKGEAESKVANEESIDEENVNKNYEAEKVGFAWNIINMIENGKYVFYMEGVAETANPEQDRLDGKRPGDIFIKNDYRLVVENTIQGKPQGYIKNKGAGASYPTLVYGTAHNWATFGNSSTFRNSAAYSNTFGNHQRFLTRFLPKALVTEQPWTTDSGELVLAVPSTIDQWSINVMVENYKSGFGTQVYSSQDLGSKPVTANLHTYDITTNPSEDYFTEPPTGKDEGTTYPDEKRNKFNVVKYYIYEDDITGEVTEISYYVTTNSPHTVIIDNEQNATGFSLKEYFTSNDDWLPENDKEPSDYPWESLVKAKHKNGKYLGTDYTTVTVTPEDKDMVLHILYTFTGKEAPSGLNVVKIYKNESDEIIKTKGPDAIENDGTYVVENEDDYEYIETLISKNEPNVNVPEGSSTTNEVVEIPSDAKTLYVIYKENPQQIKLYSNELSYTYDLRDIIKSRILFEILDVAPSVPGVDPSSDCNGHPRGTPRTRRYCRNPYKKINPYIWTLSITDSYDYNNQLNFIRDYSLSNTSTQGRAYNWAGGEKALLKPNATFLLYRDKELDLITLYPKKNDSLSSSLSTLGIENGSASYTPHGDRMISELINDKSFTNTLNTHFEYDSSRTTTLHWKWKVSGSRGSHTNEDDYNINIVTSPTDANKYYNNKNNVKEYYLLGQSNTGSEEVSDARSDSFGTKYSYNKAYSSTSSDLKFYPYHLMLYRAKNANNSPQNVYVTSENLSTMKVYNAVQLGVYKKNPINALLSSTQWSTHARSLAFEGNIDKKSVLPGGAVLDLDMGSKGDTELGIRLWQSCLRDEQVETVQQDGFTTSLSKAKEIASNYQSEVKDVLEGYGLVQWGTEGVQTDLNGVLSSGVELHNNTSLDWDGRSYSTSNDSKYYLKHNGSGSDRANFDVLENKITKQVFYEISSDVDGNVILKKDNTEIARASLTQDKSAILSNTEAKLLDDNTKLVSNYFSSIDRGLGDPDKYDRTNSRKYNEAYDGVGVLLTELSFSVGFSDNSGHRTTVLDTLLTSSSSSKSDLYNFSDEKVRSFVFATTENSTGSVEAESVGYIGTLSGDSTMNDLYTVLSDIQSFVYSKNFYTSNFNVTDLN